LGAVATPAADTEDLIAHLAGGLHPADRAAFRQAAEAALAQASVCWGPGLIHRTVATIWHQYFHPPVMPDRFTGWDLGRKPSQLIEHGDYRPSRRFWVVG
jgi:hypothetical protein